MGLTKQYDKLSQLSLLAELVFNIQRFKDDAGFIFQTVPGKFYIDLFLLVVSGSAQEDWNNESSRFQ